MRGVLEHASDLRPDRHRLVLRQRDRDRLALLGLLLHVAGDRVEGDVFVAGRDGAADAEMAAHERQLVGFSRSRKSAPTFSMIVE